MRSSALLPVSSPLSPPTFQWTITSPPSTCGLRSVGVRVTASAVPAAIAFAPAVILLAFATMELAASAAEGDVHAGGGSASATSSSSSMAFLAFLDGLADADSGLALLFPGGIVFYRYLAYFGISRQVTSSQVKTQTSTLCTICSNSHIASTDTELPQRIHSVALCLWHYSEKIVTLTLSSSRPSSPETISMLTLYGPSSSSTAGRGRSAGCM